MGTSPVAFATLFFLASFAITLFNLHYAPWHHIPIWWDLHGNPWIYGPRWLALLFLPLLTFLVPLALHKATLNNNLETHGAASKQSIFNIVVLPALFLFTIQTYVIIPAAIDPKHIFPARIFVANTALWALIWFGHNVKHVEPNNVIGIITPWTTNSSWDTLHSQAGLIFEISGILLFIAAFVVPIGWPMLLALLVLWPPSHNGASKDVEVDPATGVWVESLFQNKCLEILTRSCHLFTSTLRDADSRSSSGRVLTLDVAMTCRSLRDSTEDVKVHPACCKDFLLRGPESPTYPAIRLCKRFRCLGVIRKLQTCPREPSSYRI